jgi:hypothetical protein
MQRKCCTREKTGLRLVFNQEFAACDTMGKACHIKFSAFENRFAAHTPLRQIDPCRQYIAVFALPAKKKGRPSGTPFSEFKRLEDQGLGDLLRNSPVTHGRFAARAPRSHPWSMIFDTPWLACLGIIRFSVICFAIHLSPTGVSRRGRREATLSR